MTAFVHPLHYSPRGTIFYTPGDLQAERLAPARLPRPPFQARQRRRHSIQVTRYPLGFQFCDPPPPKERRRYRHFLQNFKSLASTNREIAKRAFGLPVTPLSPDISTASAANSTRFLTPELLRSGSESIATSLEEQNTSRNIPPGPESNMAATLTSRGLHNLGAASRSAITLGISDARKQPSSTTRPTVVTKTPSVEKPLAAAKGVSCDIVLAEPYVYLTGFDHSNNTHSSQNSTAMIRGRLILNVAKGAKIKAVTLSFLGKACTEWPEGIPPEKSKTHEEERLRYQVLPFFNANFPTTGDNDCYGARCQYSIKNDVVSQSMTNSSAPERDGSPTGTTRSSRSSTTMTAKEIKALSLGNVQSRSFTKGESAVGAAQQPQKGWKYFPPGTYEYSFEIVMDHTSPESIDFPLGSVKWYLDALIERPGPFNPNLHGVKEIKVIRAPDQNSLEQVEPIAISRKWEDQLHYDIVISGKSFALGSKIPIAFKLTPLAKVQCHRIKVFITENVDYYCNNKKVTRKDVQRKILLLERQAGKPLAEQYQASEVRTISGGELGPERRERVRMMAQNRRNNEARRLNTDPEPLPEQTENLLGDLDLGLDHLVYQTEIEMDVQLPTCAEMAKDKAFKLSPDTTYQNIQVHHWIKIVLRLSRLDTEDPSGSKRRHFEISIDSPFHILSCLATQAHTALPEYTNPQSFDGNPAHTLECGCSNAASMPSSISPSSSTGSILVLANPENSSESANTSATVPELTPPPQAHLSEGHNIQRPMHMLRHPSFAPPAFDDEYPPPPMVTPPPMYDYVIGTPSHDGLADYFARLSDAYDDDDDMDDDLTRTTSRNGRVNIANPRTPGGRVARSMEIDRTFMFRAGALESRGSRQREASVSSQNTMRA